ncbi:G-D-S-L family lipolytic protein [Flavobacterium sp. MFBS3-15]|uniref:SGNH/GDSL hydrolase family protein n=1 Tax=Flavobacterium sp. MFBS3-15 TaxID=2989816 RepID=UPI002235E950|nr:SGNH/GDSL hydrolase family protein [Flavobacterium sp. MFBS3-15]MCW4468249.1 G-D-S-L family lipolytic protein [Flavobacterium sp. MFBS3-15]
MKNKVIYLAILAAGFASCEPEFENELSNGNYSAGDADFSSYVAIGNSLTSGYMDGTVSRVSQSYSFPSILANQFALVGGGAFTQPSYAEDTNNLGGISGIPGFGTRLVIDASAGGPEPIAGTSTITLTPQASAFNNMGVPGAKTFHLLAQGYGNPAGLAQNPPMANPYYVRMATSTTSTVLGDAMMKNPTFFTNWIGNNDVLGYATSGGSGSTAGLGGADITPVPVFEQSYNMIINTLTSNGAKGVVATIPNVTAIPFFTTVPYNPLTAAAIGGGNEANGTALINQLNTSLIGPVKQVLTAYGQGSRLQLLSATEANPLLIKDESLANMQAQLTGALTQAGVPAQQAAVIGIVFGQARHATAQDLVLLSTRTVIGTAPTSPYAVDPLNKYGVTYPLDDQHILTAAEVSDVNTATTAFNNIIKAAADAKGLGVVDMNAIMNQLVSGLRVEDGSIYTANYFSTATLSTVMFSLDGVHPNARGYALIANEVIKVINSHYNAKLPLVSAGSYPGATVLPTN